MTLDVEQVTRLVGLVFVVTSMASAGLGVPPGEVAGQLRRTRLVALALIANFALAPLIAWAVARLLPIEQGYAIGLLLVSGAAGAPLLPKISERARANVPFAIVLMMLLVAGTVLFLPLVMPSILPGFQAGAGEIALPLLVFILVPLAGAMLVRARWEAAGRRAEPVLRHASDLSLVAFVVLVLATHLDSLRGALGSGAILAAVLFVGLSGAAAYAVGGPGPDTRRVLALGTAQRNIAAALVTADRSFSEQPNVVVMILVTDVVSLVALFTAARVFQRSTPPATAAGPAPPASGRAEPSGVRA